MNSINHLFPRRCQIIFRVLIACMIMCLWSSSLWATDLIDAEWLYKHLNDQNIRIVDVSNNPDSYETGHIAGALKINRHIDLADTNAIPPNLYPTKEQFEKLMPWLGIDKDTIVVAYDDKFGIYASRFLVIMELYGHDINKLKLLNGDKVRWKKRGLPINKDTVTVKPTKYEVETVRLDIFVSWRNIYRDVVRGAHTDIVLLDSRPTSEYGGKEIRSIRCLAMGSIKIIEALYFQ